MIDYYKIALSIDFYKSKGFTRIESPWTVTEKINRITAPPNSPVWTISNKDKVLVASGEQSFLYLYLKDFLPKGSFQTTTPCFRDEPFDQTHTKYFIKNELIKTDIVNDSELQNVVDTAMDFFARISKSFDSDAETTCIKTDLGYDILINGIEVGSYGIRQCEYLKWIYGTGCSEPRLSMSLLNK